MGDREWMYKGWAPNGRVTQEWIDNAQAFMDEALRKVKGPKDSKTIWCHGSSFHNFCFTRGYSSGPFTVKPVV
jgi:hypothetical protein